LAAALLARSVADARDAGDAGPLLQQGDAIVARYFCGINGRMERSTSCKASSPATRLVSCSRRNYNTGMPVCQLADIDGLSDPRA